MSTRLRQSAKRAHQFVSQPDCGTLGLEKPSIILFMFDQLTSFVLNAYGGAVFKIPNIDTMTARSVCVRGGNMKLVVFPCYPLQFYDLASDPFERASLAGTGDPVEARLMDLVERNWLLDMLPDDVVASPAARKLIDRVLPKGREELWDFTLKLLKQNTHYVRRGGALPSVERRGYLPKKNERKTQ